MLFLTVAFRIQAREGGREGGREGRREGRWEKKVRCCAFEDEPNIGIEIEKGGVQTHLSVQHRRFDR